MSSFSLGEELWNFSIICLGNFKSLLFSLCLPHNADKLQGEKTITFLRFSSLPLKNFRIVILHGLIGK